MDAAHAWAAAQGVTQTRLVVSEANPAAIAFYDWLGYATRARTMQRSVALPDAGKPHA